MSKCIILFKINVFRLWRCKRRTNPIVSIKTECSLQRAEIISIHPLHTQGDIIFRSLKIVQHGIIIVIVVFLVNIFLLSSLVGVPVVFLEYCKITLRICYPLLKFLFEVFFLICRLFCLPFRSACCLVNM
jgi:hypothetical protein